MTLSVGTVPGIELATSRSAVKRRKLYLKDVQAELRRQVDLFSVISYFTFCALPFWPFPSFIITIYLRQFFEVNFYIYKHSGGYTLLRL